MQYSNLFLVLFFLSISCLASYAQAVTPQLTLKDTVFIQYNRGVKTFQHQVRPGQTDYSLKAYYQLSDDEWNFFNPKQQGQSVFPSQNINIPIPNRAIIRYDNASSYKKNTCIPVIHVVTKGETFFGIHRRSYDIDAEVLKQRNGLQSTSLKVGQRLHVGWFDISGVPPAQEGTKALPPGAQEMLPYRDRYFERLSYRDEFEHSGMAVQSDASALRYGYKVYHQHAKIGSCIRLTNPARNATVYAEVIGRVPSTVQQQYFGREILAVYNLKIKKALGLVDRQFYAVVRFTK